MAGRLIKKGDNLWLVRVFIGYGPSTRTYRGQPITGRVQKFRTHTIHGTKREAQAVLTKLLGEKDAGELITPTRMTLAEFLDNEWLPKCVRPNRRRTTAESYETYLSLYVKPGLGVRPIAKVTPLEVQGWIAELQSRGLSSRTIRYARAILSGAFEQARKWRLVQKNPIDDTDPPPAERRELQFLTPEQLSFLLGDTDEGRDAALIRVAIDTGMRPSEYLALKWSDLDLEGRRLSVARSVHWFGAEWEFGEPKTSKGRRSIVVGPATMRALLAHRAEQAGDRLKAGAARQDHGLIFTDESGRPMRERTVYSRFKRTLERIGLPMVRLYSLRHSAATLALSEGVTVKAVSERLGHASAQMTLDVYAHTTPTMQEDAAARIDAKLEQLARARR